jgi:hypothetical protein
MKRPRRRSASARIQRVRLRGSLEKYPEFNRDGEAVAAVAGAGWEGGGGEP